jgi:Spy/CpxP family protein refolding chaperone
MGFSWKLTIAFALLFVIGGLCGSVITLALGSHYYFTARAKQPVSWEEGAMRNLTRHLKLTPEQQAKVRVPIHDAVERLSSVRQKDLQEINQEFDQTLAGLAPLLTPDQQRRLDEFRTRRMAHIRAAMAKASP